MKMHKVTIIKGCAKIVGEHEIAIQSDEKVENIEAKNISINTGAIFKGKCIMSTKESTVQEINENIQFVKHNNF